MAQAAAAIGQHYDTFRKQWPKLRKDYRFPAPFRARPYKWLPEQVEAWRIARAKALGERFTIPDDAANENPDPQPLHPSTRPPDLERQRAALRRLMHGAD